MLPSPRPESRHSLDTQALLLEISPQHMDTNYQPKDTVNMVGYLPMMPDCSPSRKRVDGVAKVVDGAAKVVDAAQNFGPRDQERKPSLRKPRRSKRLRFWGPGPDRKWNALGTKD